MEKTKKSYNLVIGVVALVAIILAIAAVGYFVSKPKPLTIQGQAEASEYRVSGKVPGRIEKIYVKEGDLVHKGDTLAMIDSPEVRAKLKQAQAAKAAAQAQSDKAQKGAQQEQIDAAYNVWQSALVQKEVMRKSYERVKKLYEQKVVSEQKYDETKAKYDASVTQAAAAKSQYDMARNGARKEDKAAAAAMVERADGAIMEVEGYLDELYLTSPADGIISAIFPKPGELVGTGSPVMTVTDLKDEWLTFNVREDYLKDMRMGAEISVVIPALEGATIPATITYMAVRDSYATWKATKESDMYDAKTFEVRAVPTEVVDGLLPGMTAIVIR